MELAAVVARRLRCCSPPPTLGFVSFEGDGRGRLLVVGGIIVVAAVVTCCGVSRRGASEDWGSGWPDIALGIFFLPASSFWFGGVYSVRFVFVFEIF